MHEVSRLELPDTPDFRFELHGLCRCGRRLEYDRSACQRCRERTDRKAAWKDRCRTWPILLDALNSELGIGRQFCRNDQLPKLTDPGLAERLEKHPLPAGAIMACGPVGTHKTHLLAARTVDAAFRGWSARLLPWQMFSLEVRDTYKQSATETEKDVLLRYSDLDYLAIDDLGIGVIKAAGKESEASRLLVWQLLNHRYERNLTTDIASNWAPEELSRRFDDRIGRRIAELCTTYVMR